MMNFIETASTVSPRPASAIEAGVEITQAPRRAFSVSLVLSMLIFSFTLTGLITAVNWVADNIVIPRYINAGMAELTKPLPNFIAASEADVVETTSVR